MINQVNTAQKNANGSIEAVNRRLKKKNSKAGNQNKLRSNVQSKGKRKMTLQDQVAISTKK